MKAIARTFDHHCRLDSDFFCALHNAPVKEFHSHVDFYEFAIVVSGSFRHFRENEETVLRVGDLIYVRPGEAHAILDNEPNSLHYVLLCRSDRFESILALHPEYKQFFLSTPYAQRVLPHQQTDYITYLASAIAREANPPHRDLIAEQLLSVLLLAIYQGRSIDASSADMDEYVSRIISIFDSYRYLNESFNSLSETFPLSQTSFIKRFKAITGYTPVEYRHRKRMEYAAVLLELENFSVATVANMVGISSLSYFSRLFKEFHGMTPKRYQSTFRK